MVPDDPRRSRLRFEHFEVDSFPDGRCRVEVLLEWKGEVFHGEAEGTQTLQGEIRAGARAALGAAAAATDPRLTMQLMGVKAIRAFDAWVVIVSIRGRGEGSDYSLIGANACPDSETTRGAALAVLDATNRILKRYVEAA